MFDGRPGDYFSAGGSDNILPNKNVTFSVAATGTLPLSYQWYFNTTNIPGATNYSLTLTNVQPGQAGPYTVLVSNGGNPALSQAANLTVMPPPSCDTVPANIVSWWSAEGNALDRIGGNNGNIGGNTTFASGEVGQGFVFNGTTSYIDLGTPTRPGNYKTSTIEASD